jgi:ribose transport system ATP-binding protein
VAQSDLSEEAIVFLATGVHEERAAEIAAGHT